MDQQQLPVARHHIQVSGSVLALRIILAIFVADFIYTTIGIIFFGNVLFSTPVRFSWLLFFSVMKLIFQSIFIVAIVLITQASEYFLTGKQLLVKKGVLTRDEKVYELHHIKSVKRHESLLAKIIGYGDITLSFAESSFREEVLLNNIREPKKYEKIFINFMQQADSTVEVKNDKTPPT